MSNVVRQTIRVFGIPGESVEFTTHRLDWGFSREFGDLTLGRCLRLGRRLERGAWFLCPKFTVYSATPSADFFRSARVARSHWLMQTRRVMGKGDPQREKRKAERRGRRAAYLELMPPAVDGDRPGRPPESINLSDLPREQRVAVFLGGMLAKELAFTGVMMIDGRPVIPCIWNRMADDLLGPEPGRRPTVTPRRFAPAAPKATNISKPPAPLPSPANHPSEENDR